MLIGKVKDDKAALFYIEKTIENGWGRDVLALQIKSDLFVRLDLWLKIGESKNGKFQYA